MANLRQRQRTFFTASALLAAVSTALLVYLLTPLSPSASAKEKELVALQSEYRSRLNSPLIGIPEKLARAQRSQTAFYSQRLSARYSAIVLELGKLAQQSGISLTAVSYTTKPEETVSGFDQVIISTAVNGDYSHIARFIREIEHSKMFFIIDQIGLSQQQRGVGLQISIETYLRSAGPIAEGVTPRRSPRTGD